MFAINELHRSLGQWVVAVCLACLICTGASASEAQEQRITELEARLSSMESLLEKLNAKLEALTAAQPGQAATGAASAQGNAVAATGATQAGSAPAAGSAGAKGKESSAESQHDFRIGGYIKLDALLSRYSGGDLPGGNTPGRNFYDPGSLPVGGERESIDFDATARTSRIHFASDHRFENGDQLGSYLEIDFINTEGGNERFSNSYVPRLRHAYVKYNDWLVGQTWSTFTDTGSYPESLDFTGPAGSVVFARQPQVRYTRNGFSVALENPETTITPNGGGPRITADDSALPDLAANYVHRFDDGHWQLAGLLRRLEYEDNPTDISDRELAWGLGFTGEYRFGRDNLQWSLTHSEGLGRYIGFNYTQDAVLTPTGRLDTISADYAYLSYRHWWNEKWRSTGILAYATIDNPREDTGLDVTKEVWSAQWNLIYSPVPALSFGLEYTYAERELEDGRSGNLQRLQFSSKYVY